MEASYGFLLDTAIILISTKLLGMLTRKMRMPQVVGALLAGLILGPALFGVLKETEYIHQVSEIGVIVLMFCAGLETDTQELKKSGKASLIIAILGVIIPLAGGFGVAYFFNKPGIINSDASATLFMQNIFIGVILTATSVSITVETLKEMGKMSSKASSAILGAAIIDDILGIIALTVITSVANPGAPSIWIVLGKIVLFFIFCAVVGYLFYRFFKKWTHDAEKDLRRFVITAFVFCLLLSYIAEEVFGVADITGAFIAGLIISNTERTKYLASRFDTLSYILIAPIFFASIGLKVVLPEMTVPIILFAVLLTVVAVLTKIVGCGLGGLFCKYTKRESVQIGVGMISRGEVALIVASKGAAMGLIGSDFLGPIVIVVVITTIIAPVFLKFAFKEKRKAA